MYEIFAFMAIIFMLSVLFLLIILVLALFINPTKPTRIFCPLCCGDIVVVHNFHVGEFLESWNGSLGIYIKEKDGYCWVKFSEATVPTGFQREYLLPLDSRYPCSKENMMESLDWVNKVMSNPDCLN